MKQRFVRTGDELADSVTVVVRGGDLDPVVLRADALRNHGIYGTYGISVFAVRGSRPEPGRAGADDSADSVRLTRHHHGG